MSAAPDVGWTHIALPVHDLERSIAFYTRYAGLHVVHRRHDLDDQGNRVAVVWLADARRVFVLVLMESSEATAFLRGFSHLGVSCPSRAEVERRCAEAQAEGCLVLPPRDIDAVAGFAGFVADPDGNHVELSYGQLTGVALGR